MKRRAVLVVACLVLAPMPADAWGFEAHKFIMGRAIALLPAQIRPFFEAERVSVVEHTIDPDLWRTAGWSDEDARHYFDLDAYGPHPFKDVPRDFDEAIKKHGVEFVNKNGTLPWRTVGIQRDLADAFKQQTVYSRENIKFFASVLAHYISDAHVPFHTTLNHDGQLTQQSGIHDRFELEMFERYHNWMRISPRPVFKIPDPRAFMFETLTQSFALVQPLLEADRQAAAGREHYDDGYYALFFGKSRPLLEARLSDSITAVASMITAAWVEAGRPALPLQAPRFAPAKIRRQ
ncbi:MAG: hypothetical protein M3541_01015 [Acidobacteriota bacterium]|nr:hypothetical protein [Acidobacteriota bacterium]MDQ3417365.1 hypothetical protein [Acidobacteriota bacterium]